jgi:hypothetical protein
MSQKQRVLNDLWRGDWRCSHHWYATGIPNARNRVGELRREGYHIESEPCPDEHGPGYFRYRLRREPVQERMAI